MLQALIFDVDGTLADTEVAHLAAFNQAFAEAGHDWYWSVPEYTCLLEISGGKERILHYWKQVQPGLNIADAGVAETVAHLHARKTYFYKQAVQQGQVALRPGVLDLIESARAAGLKLSIATTTSPANIVALLRKAMGESWQQYFAVIENAETAPNKKPHPQVYQQALQRLGLPPATCLTFEDSANGLQAARAAGLRVLVTPNGFTSHHDFTGAWRVLPDLKAVTLERLQQWHAETVNRL